MNNQPEPRAAEAIRRALEGDNSLLLRMTLPGAVDTAFRMGYRLDLRFKPIDKKPSKMVWRARVDPEKWRVEILGRICPPKNRFEACPVPALEGDGREGNAGIDQAASSSNTRQGVPRQRLQKWLARGSNRGNARDQRERALEK